MHNDLLFNSASKFYADVRPTYPVELFHFIKQHSPGFERAWDCATGNGQAAVSLAELFTEVTASDVSANQIAHAFPRQNIHYSVQHAEQTRFDNQQFDTICVAQALHWFNFPRFWPEVHRLLKDGGLFIAFSYAWCQVTTEVDAVLDRWREAILPYWAANNQTCWDQYRTVDFPFRPLPVPVIDMLQHWQAAEYMGYIRSWSASEQFIAQNGDVLFAEICTDAAAAWGNPNDKKPVHFPLTVIAGHRW